MNNKIHNSLASDFQEGEIPTLLIEDGEESLISVDEEDAYNLIMDFGTVEVLGEFSVPVPKGCFKAAVLDADNETIQIYHLKRKEF